MRKGGSYLGIEVGHVLCEFIELILAFHEVLLELDEGTVPEPALHDSGKDELPLFLIFLVGLYRVRVVL